MVIGLRPNNSVLVIIAENGSTIGNQIRWLFGLSDEMHPRFSIRGELESEQDRIAFASRIILEQIGVAIEDSEKTYLDDMISRFGRKFPQTCDFSRYARSTLRDIEPLEDVDGALVAWIEREEILFRTFEKHLIGDRLEKGFTNDVEGFIAFSLSVQNRRKSRIGYALENHLEEIFRVYNISYSRTKITENRSRPDFIFPSIEKYHDNTFDPLLLTMLGVKSTCKDRWRQVLSEADKIESKHLLTLEAAISENQTGEMKERNLQLVIPKGLHSTYTDVQRSWLIDMSTFINIVNDRQARANRV